MHTTLRRRLLGRGRHHHARRLGGRRLGGHRVGDHHHSTSTSVDRAVLRHHLGLTAQGHEPRPAVVGPGRGPTASGQHACYDRVVFDIGRGAGTLGYSVRYVSAVTSPGSGLPVAVSGGARLQVTINAPSMLVERARRPTRAGAPSASCASVGSFEGYTDYGLGRAGPAADAGLRARRRRRRAPPRRRRRPRLVTKRAAAPRKRSLRGGRRRRGANCIRFDGVLRTATQEPEPAFLKPAFSASSADLNQNSAIVWSYHWPSGSW